MSRYLLVLLLCFLGLGFGQGFKVPFRVNDVLPVLPRQLSWPVLNNFHSAVDLLPYYVGSVTPNNGSIEWKGACFYGNEARLEFTEGDREPALGGGILYLKVTLLVYFDFYYCHFVFLYNSNSDYYRLISDITYNSGHSLNPVNKFMLAI